MIKSIYLILAIILFHYLFGWIYGVVLVALLAGYVFTLRPVLISTTIGFLLSAAEVAHTYFTATEPVGKMLDLSSRILVDFPDYAIIIISLSLPVIFYNLAAWFSYNVYVIYRKLSV